MLHLLKHDVLDWFKNEAKGSMKIADISFSMKALTRVRVQMVKDWNAFKICHIFLSNTLEIRCFKAFTFYAVYATVQTES